MIAMFLTSQQMPRREKTLDCADPNKSTIANVTLCMITPSSDGFSAVQTKRPHRAPPKKTSKSAP